KEWVYNHHYVFFMVIALSTWLMNSNIPLFSLKVNKLDESSFVFILILAVTSAVLIYLLSYAAMPLIILLYIILSLVKNSFQK
ncbi:hypothetical protein RZS08_19075, partial [Arthrospira platensis SPKY1]|nr:hypothetical protein [Arthrospira platensis SPKY1]